MRSGKKAAWILKAAAAKRRKAKPAPIGDQSANAQDGREPTQAHRNGLEGPECIEKGWHSEEREHHRKERAYWRLTAFLTAIAAFGAIGSVILSQCSLQEARVATREAHTQAVEAKRQAEAAEKNLPRAWLVIDFKQQFPEMKKVDTTPGKQNIWITVFFSVSNFGSLPALIEYVHAEMLIPADSSFENKAPENLDQIGQHLVKSDAPTDQDSAIYFSSLIGHVLYANSSNQLTQPNGTDFFFHNRPDLLVHFFPKQWIYIRIGYRDPFGLHTACAYVDARFDFPRVANDKYNNCT